MKAIQVLNPGKVKLVDIDKPDIRDDNDVLIKVKAAGICGSDIHTAHGSNPYASYPRIIGHEISGEVVGTGRSVIDFKIGDRVVVEPIQYCGKCYACQKGRPNVCKELKVTSIHVDGGYREYMVVDCGRLHKIPDQVSFIQAAVIEPYTIGAQANWRAGTAKDDIILVHGAGPIGLIICDTAKSTGAVCIVSEIDDQRLERAKAFGADYTINPVKENLRERIRMITAGMGPNIIFEATGHPGLMAESVDMVSTAGTVVALSYGSTPVCIDFQQVNKKEVTIVGTRLQCFKFAQVIKDFPKRLDRVDKLITHVFPFEEFEAAFSTFEKKIACKVVLEF